MFCTKSVIMYISTKTLKKFLFIFLTIIIFIVSFIYIKSILDRQNEYSLKQSKMDSILNIKRKRLLPDNLTISNVALNVKNLESSREFYTKILELKEKELINNQKYSYSNGDNQIFTIVKSDGKPTTANEAGLYHTAIVYESREYLGYILDKVLNKIPKQYVGSGDHNVSESFYIEDPEGNEIELYFDKPMDEWKIGVDDKLKYGNTGTLDTQQFIRKYNSNKINNSLMVRHIHLKGGDMSKVRNFYIDILGFDSVTDSKDAIFMSAGGYHHNIAVNNWQSENASFRELGNLGLQSFDISLKNDKKSFDALITRLDTAKWKYKLEKDTIIVSDDWGTVMNIYK